MFVLYVRLSSSTSTSKQSRAKNRSHPVQLVRTSCQLGPREQAVLCVMGPSEPDVIVQRLKGLAVPKTLRKSVNDFVKLNV